jgi:single-stranded DNA-specific DHH superfamily exonuclease
VDYLILKLTAVEKVSGGDVSLIITVDNGSSAHEALGVAKNKGIDVIVTDHHDILRGHPDCYAFINPKRSDNRYPYLFLAIKKCRDWQYVYTPLHFYYRNCNYSYTLI